MRLNLLKCKVVDGTDAATLEAAVASFLAAGNERQFVAVEYVALPSGTARSVVILYTEG